MQEVTDPNLLAQLNAAPPREVTDPALLAQLNGSPATAGDRVQAGEAGVLKGAAYLAGAIPDAVMNTVNLGKAGIGSAYIGVTGKAPPKWLEAGDVSPVGNWLSQQLDKSPVTTTQLNRPDDAASRYLSAAGSVVPAVAAGGGSLPSMLSMTGRAAVPAVAGQAVAEAHPFQEDWKNNAAATLAQALTGKAMAPRVSQPARSVQNKTVQTAQDNGFIFPPATTNPSAGNKLRETIAGKMDVQQHAALHNTEATNNAARADLGLPGKGPIDPTEIAKIYRDTKAPYQAIRGAGAIPTSDPSFAADMQKATSTLSGASNVSAALGGDKLPNVVQDILSKPVHDAGDLIDTADRLRDEASAAFRAGDNGRGAAYKGVAKAIEDQIELGASRNGQVDLVKNFQDARRQRAIAHTVEDALNTGSGDVDARKLAKEDFLTGKMKIAAEAAKVAPLAFKPQTSSPGTHHLGFWGSAVAAGAAGEHMFPGHGWAAAAIPFGVNAARAGTRMYALGPLGQRGAVATQKGPVDPRQMLATALSAQERANAQ